MVVAAAADCGEWLNPEASRRCGDDTDSEESQTDSIDRLPLQVSDTCTHASCY